MFYILKYSFIIFYINAGFIWSTKLYVNAFIRCNVIIIVTVIHGLDPSFVSVGGGVIVGSLELLKGPAEGLDGL